MFIDKFDVSEEFLKEVKLLSGQGLTQQQIHRYYGMGHCSWNRLKKKKPQIERAVMEGKSKAIAGVTGQLMSKIKKGDLTAIIFYLKTQAGWSEKNTINVRNDVKSKNQIYRLDTTDPIEASKIYQSIMTGSYNNERNSTSQ